MLFNFSKMSKSETLTHLAFFILVCSLNVSFLQSHFYMETKVAWMLVVEPQDPKCFAEGMRDLTCFWEDRDGCTPDQYKFTYTYQNEKSSECMVTAEPAGGSKGLFFCRLPKVQHYVSLDLHVTCSGRLLHNRTLFIDLVFLLDPPANLTAMSSGNQGKLRLSWLAPPLKYMDNRVVYEVSYATAGSPPEKVVQGQTKVTLEGLQPETRYEVRVRVKPDGIIYDGYWSAWTPSVFVSTPPNDLDPIILSLSLILSLVLLVLSLTALLSHRRFLLKKMWPLIPGPENTFPGLFTVCGGNFQEWLEHSSGGLWWRPAIVYLEDLPSPLEVLSEASVEDLVPTCKEHSRGSGWLEEDGEENRKDVVKVDTETKDSRKEPPQEHWLMDQLLTLHQQHHLFPQSSLLECKDVYVTLNQSSQPNNEERPLEDVSEESGPLQVLFATTGTATSHSDLESLQQSSGSGRLSSQSSFEYPHYTWPTKSLNYTCLTVADSGISVDYSPMISSITDVMGMGVVYANHYKNEFSIQWRPLSEQPSHSGF